jgi:hypothetical protein
MSKIARVLRKNGKYEAGFFAETGASIRNADLEAG